MSPDTLFNRASGLAEVVIPPRSGLVGQAVFPGMVTPSGDLIILAVQRRGEDLGPQRDGAGRRRHAAAPGDLEGARRAPRRPRRARRRLAGARPPAGGSRWAPGRSRRIAVLLAMVVAPRHGRRAVGRRGAGRRLRHGPAARAHGRAGLPLDQLDDGHPGRRHDPALDRDGPDRRGAPCWPTRSCDVVGDAGPYALLAGLFVLTAILGQLISNTATALIIIPIARGRRRPRSASRRGRC